MGFYYAYVVKMKNMFETKFFVPRFPTANANHLLLNRENFVFEADFKL